MIDMKKYNNSIINIWIRNDDVSDSYRDFYPLVQLYKLYQVKVMFAVIPTTISDECIKLLLNDDYFEIAQHGYSHKNHLKGLDYGYKSELCKERDLSVIEEEILKGKEKLELLTGREVTTLVPPFNHIDKSVQDILSKHFKNLSVFLDHTSSFENDINPNIDILNWHKGGIFDQEYFERKFIELLEKTNDIGICIHHNFLKEEDIEYLYEFFEELSKLENCNIKRRVR